MKTETKNVIALGLVSFFNDLSSEVIARVLPLYLLVVVKTSVLGIGVVEAIADGTAVFSKLLAGIYSDRLARRKPFVFVGYALSVLSRPLILVIPSLNLISFSRFMDKVGKGVRTAPRDALVADLSGEKDRGFHYGIIRSLDTLGAVLGLGSVAVVLTCLKNSGTEEAFRQILLWASVAGIFALLVLWFGVQDSGRRLAKEKEKISFAFSQLDGRLKRYMAVAFIFALASSSDAFIIVRARDIGFSVQNIFFLLTAFNMVSAIAAYVLSDLSDRMGRKVMMVSGWLVYGGAYFIFGLKTLSPALFSSTVCVYGLFYGFTDGVEKAMVADFQSSREKKGLAFGCLGLVNGLGIIPANLLFSFIYYHHGASGAFWFSGGLALIGAWLLSFLKTTDRLKKA